MRGNKNGVGRKYSIALITEIPVRQKRLWQEPAYRARVLARPRAGKKHRPPKVLGKCFYCPSPATGWDHTYPRELGGPDLADNKVLACQPCNASKSCLTIDEWAKTRRGIILEIGAKIKEQR